MLKIETPDRNQQLFQMPMLSLNRMKKILAFIWLVIYMVVSSGFAVSTHYCMDEKQSVELGTSKKEVCDICGMHKSKSKGCCRDEVKVIKLQQDTQLAKIQMPSLALDVPMLAVPLYLASPFYNFTQTTSYTAFEPPPLPGCALYVANCVFRI